MYRGRENSVKTFKEMIIARLKFCEKIALHPLQVLAKQIDEQAIEKQLV